MAKRFTDTGKWAKQGFCDLSLKMKVVWMYLCDNCDHAGVWDMNMGLMSYQIGSKISLEEMIDGLGERIELRGNKILLTNFVEFQYGTLNPENKVHLSVIKRLENLAPSKPLERPMQGPKDKDMDKERDMDKDMKGGVGENEPTLNFDELYSLYPRKEGKAKGVEKLKSFVRDQDTFDRVKAAIGRYINNLKTNKTEPKYIKHFSTWVNNWTDWDDPNAGSSIVTNKKYENEREIDHDAEMKEIWGQS